jgi:hypothetical protein
LRFRKVWVAIFLSKPELGSQLEFCHPGDLICCSRTDASIGKTSDYTKSIQKAYVEKMLKLVKLVGMLLQAKVYLFWIN